MSRATLWREQRSRPSLHGIPALALLRTDPPGKCSRWHVVVYDKETAKKDWYTVRGTRDDAKQKKRELEGAKADDEYLGPGVGLTFEEVAKEFMADRRANNRRVSTLGQYETELKLRLLPQIDEKLPALGPRKIRKAPSATRCSWSPPGRADSRRTSDRARKRGRPSSTAQQIEN